MFPAEWWAERFAYFDQQVVRVGHRSPVSH